MVCSIESLEKPLNPSKRKNNHEMYTVDIFFLREIKILHIFVTGLKSTNLIKELI